MKSLQRSSIHDHAGSLGGIRILQGELTECLFGRAANGMIKSLSSADYAIEETRVEETSLIHQISNLQAENGKTVSVHTCTLTLFLVRPSSRRSLPSYGRGNHRHVINAARCSCCSWGFSNEVP